MAVEGEIGVCQVMNDHEFIFFCIVDNLLEELQFHHLSCGIVRIGNDQQLRSGPCLFGGVLQVFQEISIRADGNRPHIPAGNDGRIRMDGISRIGGKHHIPGTHQNQYQMR